MNVNTTTLFVPNNDIIAVLSVSLSLLLLFFFYSLFYYFFSECIDVGENNGKESCYGVIMYISIGIVPTLIINFFVGFAIYFNFWIMWITTILTGIVFGGSIVLYGVYLKRYKNHESF